MYDSEGNEEKVRRKKKELTKEELEAGRKEILNAVSSSDCEKLRFKVAWILNHFPAARDSDIALSLKFWEQFESEFLDGDKIRKENLFNLTKTTSLTRERARIQNEYRLFLASKKVRKSRGKLEEDYYSTAITQQPDFPVSVIYADESGKNSRYLVVGSLWIFNGYETRRLQKLIDDWKVTKGITYEFHFSELTKQKLPDYKELIDVLYRESSLLGFKGMYIEKAGTGDQANTFGDLFYHLVIKGLDYGHTTNRTPYPRTVQFLKDKESEGGDKILLRNLKDRLQQAAAGILENCIYVDVVTSVDSKSLIHIQLTDLFTGAINRHLNYRAESTNHKDEFTNYFFEKFNIQSRRENNEDIVALFT